MNMKINKKPDGFGNYIVTCSARHHGKTVMTAGGVFAKGDDAKFIKHFVGAVYGPNQHAFGIRR